MRRPVLLLLAAAGLAGCSDIIPSPRENAYEHRLFSGTQELSFRWSRDDLPLRIYVDPASPIYEHTLTAISRWQDALNYGEFRGELVTDSLLADIIMHDEVPGSVDPGDPGEPGGTPLLRLATMAPQCGGETQLDIQMGGLTLRRPIRVFVWPNSASSPEALTTCFRLTTTHELGHALGIMQHSPSAADVMYYNPVFDGVSVADRETLEIVFHSLPTLTMVRDGQ